MMERLSAWDRQLFLWLNGQHSPAGDTFWATITERTTWYPLYALLIVFFIWRWRWQGVAAILLMVVAVVVADQVASGLLKPLVARPRPCHEPRLAGLVHTVGGKCGGAYGFVSSHAANSFAVALCVWGYLRGRWPWVGGLWLVWAALVSYSRIYVGVHYPADVLVGAAIGLGTAGLALWAYARLHVRLPGRPVPYV